MFDGSLVAWVDDRQRSSQPGVYVAGEATGVGGARLALREGELAALTAAEDAGLPSAPRRTIRLRRAIRRGRAFAEQCTVRTPCRPAGRSVLDDDTTVCRCEEVTAGDIRHAREDLGAHDQRTVKLLARPGMGWCQGRVCGYATACLARRRPGRCRFPGDAPSPPGPERRRSPAAGQTPALRAGLARRAGRTWTTA